MLATHTQRFARAAAGPLEPTNTSASSGLLVRPESIARHGFDRSHTNPNTSHAAVRIGSLHPGKRLEAVIQRWKIGDVTVTQIVASTFEGLDAFLPDATPAAVLPIEWLRPDLITAQGVLRFSIHASVIETPTRRIIVDTCVGNDEPAAPRPHNETTQHRAIA